MDIPPQLSLNTQGIIDKLDKKAYLVGADAFFLLVNGSGGTINCQRPRVEEEDEDPEEGSESNESADDAGDAADGNADDLDDAAADEMAGASLQVIYDVHALAHR